MDKMKNELYNSLLQMIQASLWNNEPPAQITQELYEEMKFHSIACLVAPILPSLSIDPVLLNAWKKDIVSQLYQYFAYTYEQSMLGISIPYVVLKGTAAAQYYPEPGFRAMGDIDLMTSHEDLDQACRQLENTGFRKIKESNREVVYFRKGMVVELHRRFASLNDVQQAEFLDRIIVENITPSHYLPDLINGLTLLEHISQHLENGLGLRQIIDWMLFVNQCLPDEKWPDFLVMVKRIGLEKLAIVSTRMCELYLGLPKRKWCSNADENLCDQLMNYVLSSGNFGNKRTTDAAISEDILAKANTPKMAYKLLQNQGLLNWKLAKKYKMLRPFAWIYQAFRYASKGFKRHQATSKIKEEFLAARKRNVMLDALGVKRTAKGIVIIKDGKYVKR